MATFSYTSPNVGDSDYVQTFDTFINQVGTDITGLSNKLDVISLYINDSLTAYINGSIDHTLKDNKSFYFGTNNDFRIRSTGSSGTHIAHSGAGDLFITSGASALSMFKNAGITFNNSFTLSSSSPNLRLFNKDSGQLSTIVFLDTAGTPRSYIYKTNSNGDLLIDVRNAAQDTLASIVLTENQTINITATGGVTSSGNFNIINGTLTTPYIVSSFGGSFGSTLAVSALSVSSSTTLAGFLQVNNSTTITGNLIVNGTINGSSGGTDPNPTFNSINVTNSSLLNGYTQISANAYITGSLTADGLIALRNNTTITGTCTVSGFTQVNNSARITGNLTVDGTINGSGGGTDPNPTFNSVSVTTNINVGGAGIFGDSVQAPVLYDASSLTIQVGVTDVVILTSSVVSVNKVMQIVVNTGSDLLTILADGGGKGIYIKNFSNGHGLQSETSGSGHAVFGDALGSGIGIFGKSAGDHAIFGECSSSNINHAGVYGVGKYTGIIASLSNTVNDNNLTYGLFARNPKIQSGGANYGVYSDSHMYGISTVVFNDNQSYTTAGILVDNRTTGTGTSFGIFCEADSFDYFANGTGTYTPFTGSHQGLLLNNNTVEIGDIAIDTQFIYDKGFSDSIFLSNYSTYASQENAIGIYTNINSELTNEFRPAALKYMPQNEYDIIMGDNKLCSINSVGEGSMNVCGQSGDIVAGDLIVTSDIAGKGMKQLDNIVRSHTVARARQDMLFANASEIKKIACIYLCG